MIDRQFDTPSGVDGKVHISELLFNNTKNLKLSEDDIVVFVGPNNSGKSRALKDIETAVAVDKPESNIIILRIQLAKENMEQIQEYIKIIQERYIDPGYDSTQYHYHIDNKNALGNIRAIFMRVMSTEDRLALASPVSGVDKGMTHPIHFLMFNEEALTIFNAYFYRAFGFNAYPDSSGSKTSLKISKPYSLGMQTDFGNSITQLNSALRLLPALYEQGDGMRSFAGIVLNMLLKQFCITIIDEPETFLHPPQAYIMGNMLGELSVGKQVFLATHSIDIIKGLIDKCPERLKIVRITRNDNENAFSILENQMIQEIRHDSVLKHTNILDSMFYDNVILCESDTDCMFYSAITTHIFEKEKCNLNSFFIHSNGKDRMPQIVSSLSALNLSIKVIVDIDLLNDELKLKQLITSYGLQFSEIERDYRIVFNAINNGGKSEIDTSEAQDKILKIFASNKSKSLTKESMSKINGILKASSKWGIIKKGGKHCIPSGQASIAFSNLSVRLKSVGIFLVEVGEIESFVRVVGGHGSSWVSEVFAKYPDLE